MSDTKYNLKLDGTVSDGKYTQKFTEKDVDHIELSFGNKKIGIGQNTKHALKLQELVKKRLEGTHKSGHKILSDEAGYLAQELRSLIEDSKQ